jgi:hypothetical protein
MHPRLALRQQAIAKHLGLDDPVEIDAALEDLETLLVRCGYHWRYTLQQRAEYLARRRGSRTSSRSSERRRGRPRGSANWASRQLALGLAMIWAEQRGGAPTRRVDGYGDFVESGPYRDFVACVLEALPDRARPKRKGHLPSVDYFVRKSIEEFHDARGSADEARRRGLLAEELWNPS